MKRFLIFFLLVSAATVLHAAQPFDVVQGNLGVVSIKKAPEDITVSDVRLALSLPRLDAKTKALDCADAPSLWTAAKVGLQEGTNAMVGNANAAALRAALDNPNCVGLKLDKIYYVKLPMAGGITLPRYYNGDDGRASAIVIPRDFVIDGEVDGEAVGGFITRDILFYTEHSLNLRKVRTVTTNGCKYFTYFLNCAPRGMEQFQTVGCVFENEVADFGGRYIYFYCENANPHDSRWMPVSRNHIRHIYVDSCTFHGHSAISSDCLRVTESCRILSSTFDQLRGSGIEMCTNNNKAYATLMSYMSCPFYLVGNQFHGVERVLRKRVMWVTYYCGALVENSSLYMLHNSITNFVSGEVIMTDEHGQKVHKRPSVYDIYFNGQQLYYANNYVENVVSLTKDQEAAGIIKSKGHGIPTRYIFGKKLLNGNGHRRTVRYYKKNRYLIKKDKLEVLWAARTYPSGGNTREEMEYDRNLVINDVLSIKFQGYTGKTIPIADFTFSNNIIDAGTGNIVGIINSNQWLVTHFICDNNLLNAARISSDEWWGIEKYPKREWLFPIRLNGYWGKTILHATGNVFNVTSRENIRFLLSKYDKEIGDGYADRITYSNNKCSAGSIIRTARLNTSTWGAYQPFMQGR